MKKILKWILIVGIILFSLSYQSLLIDRNVSDIPFTPNIFVSISNVKKICLKHNEYPDYYYRKINDSITVYYTLSETASYNFRVSSAGWQIKYEDMTPENTLKHLDKYGLFLVSNLDSTKDLFTKKRVVFSNKQTKQLLIGSFDKIDNYFYIQYDYPKTYITYEESDSFLKSFKDLMIGAPH